MGKNFRSGLMFTIACITSPCCTPLIVPLLLALLAGTPAALWLGQRIGWVYTGLTLISVISLMAGLRWMYRASTQPHATPKALASSEYRSNGGADR